MSMRNLKEYSNKYSKISGSSYQIWRDESDNSITNSESFKLKSKVIDTKIAVPLIYLCNL